ncbi:uncharacterized protein LOC131957982 isoform X1 [Physella acuta]|uniref:uncharacterized protein LOC131957982 isoform X1 n=1 Tax=Physella acuta TaxID=109671 RepID=UPI0027DDC076|nr:uncharacterized protein LOC131957982 isoform X1 [Physella acuta]
MKTIVIILVLFVAVSTTELKQKKWDNLKVTWGMNPFNSQYFAGMPRTAAAAERQGFHKISDCNTTAKWRGQRYVLNNDYSVVLLYDVMGYIAGIQTTVPKGGNYPSSLIRPPFVDDGDRWAISAYFVDPATICTTGRTQAMFDQQGTGTNLYFQNSTVPEHSVLIPHKQADIGSTRWTEGRCFISMGKHYWYNMNVGMNCDNIFPAFLLYNGGELTAFGWALIADLRSPRYEHPRSQLYGLFIKDVPTCLYNAGTLSTMHIYLSGSSAMC